MTHDVLNLLNAMEQELKKLALWEGLPPSPEALASTTPFCMNTLRLSQWLQWIFIPRVRAIIDQGAELPVGANMKPYAEEAFAVDGVHSTVLLDIIGQLDQVMS
ncbi:YqcC family protein [Candidatus Sororendozoicomonas aggregata]|uniref:YqcC family protein n=1 Tax=Candidatus Sororendozoicomonas aggregata TaxID=3073239 RepID=UPI002ED24C5C